MNNSQAKKVIVVLTKKWGIRNKKFLLETIDFLDKNTNQELSFSNEFELSFIEREKNIRLLHLDFWKPEISKREIKKILERRQKSIKKNIGRLIKIFDCKYNLNILKSFFEFNQQSGLWPIQFGLEYKNEPPKIKIYLSINGQNFPFNFFCNNFDLKYEILQKKTGQRKLDAVAIDFLSNGEYIFKFYPLDSNHSGWLYRVNKNSEILSVKEWQRLIWGLTLKEMSEKKLNIKLPLFLKNFIVKNSLKISYFCQEGNKKSIYFR